MSSYDTARPGEDSGNRSSQPTVAVPPITTSAWDFRTHCSMGSVMPNAICCAALAPGQPLSTCIGSTEGALQVYTPGIDAPRTLIDFESISVVLATDMEAGVLVVVCVEGTVTTVVCDAAELAVKGRVLAPPNCVSGVAQRGRLYLGSLDRRINVLAWDVGSGRYVMQRTVQSPGQIYSLAAIVTKESDVLIVGAARRLEVFEGDIGAEGAATWSLALDRPTASASRGTAGAGYVAFDGAIPLEARASGDINLQSVSDAVTSTAGARWMSSVQTSMGTVMTPSSASPVTVDCSSFTSRNAGGGTRSLPVGVDAQPTSSGFVMVVATEDGHVMLLDAHRRSANVRSAAATNALPASGKAGAPPEGGTARGGGIRDQSGAHAANDGAKPGCGVASTFDVTLLWRLSTVALVPTPRLFFGPRRGDPVNVCLMASTGSLMLLDRTAHRTASCLWADAPCAFALRSPAVTTEERSEPVLHLSATSMRDLHVLQVPLGAFLSDPDEEHALERLLEPFTLQGHSVADVVQALASLGPALRPHLARGAPSSGDNINAHTQQTEPASFFDSREFARGSFDGRLSVEDLET